MTLLRGRRDGLEVTLPEHALDAGLDQLAARLAQQPSFYNGSSAVANFGTAVPTLEIIGRLRAVLSDAGITLRGLAGGSAVEELAVNAGLLFESRPEIKLSDSARSLIADFAGARKDIAARRRRGEASVPRLRAEPKEARQPALRLVEAHPTARYETATLRGGQALHHTGNIVVVGDINPGAEVVATGDIVVFGRLAGIAHAGAAGDAKSRIFAVELAPTQLRIATYIAAEQGAGRRDASPEVALVRDGQITILALSRLGELPAASMTT
ncbi:MAG: septum site-determining protein MinC [Candidatus Eremiobacteraeota bacterium]|nr:septum site-determining protein MinC [Candidatus Eremiobacteraeota bacterium]MBV9264520.1 septum site-determining protein MinC [Candidatus Eremiobacteraeota bacterium]